MIPNYATDCMIDPSSRAANRMSSEEIERQVADLTKRIDAMEIKVKALKRRRNSLSISLRVRQMHATNPDFVRKLREGHRRMQEDPERYAAYMERLKTSTKKLPNMTPEQKRKYDHFRRVGSREEALRLAGVRS